jgi:hypothetical protein
MLNADTNYPHRRDIVCVGVTDGGALPLARLVSQLPADFPAAVFVLSDHEAATPGPSILGRCAVLPVAMATHDEPIACGRVRVAPADRQLALTDTTTELGDIGVEQRVRPSIGALFRSAAVSFGRRVIAVVVGGERSEDGDAVRVIRSHGGVVVVAASNDVPSGSVASLCGADYVVPLDDVVELLVRLTAPSPAASGSFLRRDHEPHHLQNLVVAAERVEVISLLVDVAAATESLAAGKSVQLRCVWDRGVTVVLANRRRLRRVLTNMLAHTIDLTPRGGAVLLSAEPGAGEVRFCIVDTGSVSTLAEREHVFDDAPAFAREPDDTDPSSVIREFVEAHGGRIWLDSDARGGTSFYFTLPSLPCVTAGSDARCI